MDQKNYTFLFCSLLMASFMSISPMAIREDDFDDEGPMQRERTMSPAELDQEKDNYEWAQKYAAMVARHFFRKNIDQIDIKDLDSYLKNNTKVAEDSLYADRSYMLGAVNGVLAKYSSKKNLDEAKEKEFEENLDKIINSLKKDKKTSIAGFSEILNYAKKLNLSNAFIKQLEQLSDRQKGNLFLMVDAMLPNIREIARALDLAFEIEKENKRQGKSSQDRERDQHNEKVTQVARALNLAKANLEKTESEKFELEKFGKKHNLAKDEDFYNFLIPLLARSSDNNLETADDLLRGIKTLNLPSALVNELAKNKNKLFTDFKEYVMQKNEERKNLVVLSSVFNEWSNMNHVDRKDLSIIDALDKDDFIQRLQKKNASSELIVALKFMEESEIQNFMKNMTELIRDRAQEGAEDFDRNEDKLEKGLFATDDEDTVARSLELAQAVANKDLTFVGSHQYSKHKEFGISKRQKDTDFSKDDSDDMKSADESGSDFDSDDL